MRSALWASLVALVLASASCGGGTEETSVDNPTAGTTAGSGGGGMAGGGMGGMSGVGGSVCGDRVVDAMANEQCEPTMPHGLTCEGLGMGRGMIMCSSSCRLMMMCAPPENMGGTDGGGTAGNGG